MRVRTEDKRRQIVEVAADLFEELGYDRTSMSLISQRVGGSKATLYGYFASKEDLLLAVLDIDVTEQADRLMGEFLSAPDLRKGLIQLGTAYLRRRLHSRTVSNCRLVAVQPEESGIGKVFYDTVLGPAWQRLANRFRMMMDEGRLQRADPWVAAMQWKGLCEWDLFEQRLIGAMREADPEEIDRAATTAADAFLKLYGVQDAVGKRPAPRDAEPRRSERV